jgi:hypothetical protein
MTMHDDDHEPEHPTVARTFDEAQSIVKKVAMLLQLAGWDAIVISISRAVETAPGHFQAPGATATVIAPDCEPIVPQIVEVLRKQAAALEQSSSEKEITSGYIHDQSNYASGLTEWPK